MNALKNHLRHLIIILTIGLLAPAVQAKDPSGPIRINKENLAKLSPAEQERALAIAARLETITTMDRSSLTREERAALRNETRALRNEVDALNSNGTVIRISLVALLLIILIIILIT